MIINKSLNPSFFEQKYILQLTRQRIKTKQAISQFHEKIILKEEGKQPRETIFKNLKFRKFGRITLLMSLASVDLSSYRDQHFKGTRYEQEKLLKNTTTLYVGNLAFYTT